MDISALRANYQEPPLERAALSDQPMAQLAVWLAEAAQAGVEEPNAMALATATPDGRTSVRMVLAKALDEAGITFYTNLRSRKAREVQVNPWAAVTFYWRKLHRQVTAAGAVEAVSREVAEAYWNQRPRGSQLGAWASHQDEMLGSRVDLERRLIEVTERFNGRPVPLPDEWGGFRLFVDRMEVWQGQPDRLHDRFQYRKDGAVWVIERLSP